MAMANPFGPRMRMRLRRYLTKDHSDLLPFEIGRMEREVRERAGMPPRSVDMTADDMWESAEAAAAEDFRALSPFMQIEMEAERDAMEDPSTVGRGPRDGGVLAG